MRSKLLILFLILSVACVSSPWRFNPQEIKRGEAKILAQEEQPGGYYLVTAGFVRKFYDDCVKSSGDKRGCEIRTHSLVVAENLDGTFWVKPSMVEEFQKKEKEKK